jgi:hypothetical protein
MEDRIGGRVDPDTKTMLQQIVMKERRKLVPRDGEKKANRKVTETSVLIELIRDRHEREFPDRWDDAGYKFYSSQRQTA